MKKVFFAPKQMICFKSSVYLLCLLALCAQSCQQSIYQLTASADLSKQRFKGPSYPNPSDNSLEPGQNIGLLIVAGSAYGESQLLNYNNRASGSSNFYASTDNGAAAFFNPDGNLVKKRSQDFTDNLFFKGGLELIDKRSGDDGSTTSLNYLQIPLFAMYNYQLNGRGAGSLFGGLGPYLAYGIGGNMGSGKEKISAFSDPEGFKRFDAGLGINIGYQMPQSFSFSLGYDIGLANIQKNAFGDKAQNRSFSLNVAYPLDKLVSKIRGN